MIDLSGQRTTSATRTGGPMYAINRHIIELLSALLRLSPICLFCAVFLAPSSQL